MPIYRTHQGWKIENVKGVSKTYAQALKRLRAIEISKLRRNR